MHHHVVQIPEIDVGQIAGQDLLDFGINLLAPGLVQGPVTLFQETVDAGIGVEPAVGAFGRKAGGVKRVFEDVRVLVAEADPAQVVELEVAVHDVGIKKRKLKAADVQGNADLL